MSAKMIVTGNLGQEPELKYSKNGNAYLTLNIAATHSEKNRDTNQWGDIGEPLWIRAPFFGTTAEHLTNFLTKGTKVTVEGTLIRETYQKQDGTPGESLELRWPRFLGVIPRRDAAQDATGQAQTSYGTPNTPTPMGGAQNDPWGKDAFNQEPPF